MQPIQSVASYSPQQLPQNTHVRPMLDGQAFNINAPMALPKPISFAQPHDGTSMGVIQHLTNVVQTLVSLVSRLLGGEQNQLTQAEQVESLLPVETYNTGIERSSSLSAAQPLVAKNNDSIGNRIWNMFSLDTNLKKWGTKAIDWVADKAPDWMKNVGSTMLDWGSKVWNYFK